MIKLQPILRLSSTLFVLGLYISPGAADAASRPKDGHEVMANYERASQLLHVNSTATLTNQEATGPAKVKRFNWWRKLADDKIHYRTLTHFLEPAEIRGEEILFLEQASGQADVLLYLPAYKKTRRVETQAQSGSFMGSEFSYADLATPHLEDFNYKMREDAPCLDNSTCYVVEVTPKSDDVRDRTGYKQSVYWVRTDNFMISKADHFDLQGQLLKKFIADKTQEVDVEGHHWLSLKLQMTNVKSGKTSSLEFSEVKTKGDLPESKFSLQNLGHN